MPPTNQTSAQHAAVAARISGPRLAPYLAATEGNVRRALSLYQWNVELSGAVYECLHRFEVILRNALDEQLCGWNSLQHDRQSGRLHSPDWLLDPARLLQRLVGDDIRKATRRAHAALRGAGRPPGHPDVLAQLSFGTWRFLLPDNDPGRQYLWNKALASAFPALTGSPADLVRHVDNIYKLRNRVAHLEPLLNSSMVGDRFARMRTVLLAIDPALETWLVSRQRVTATLKTKP